MKTIKINYQGTHYCLRYTLNTIKKLADKGIGIDDIRNIGTKPWITLDWVAGAFLADHPNVSMETIEGIYKSIPNKAEFLGKLADCYSEPIDALMDDPGEDSKGNAEWETNW